MRPAKQHRKGQDEATNAATSHRRPAAATPEQFGSHWRLSDGALHASWCPVARHSDGSAARRKSLQAALASADGLAAIRQCKAPAHYRESRTEASQSLQSFRVIISTEITTGSLRSACNATLGAAGRRMGRYPHSHQAFGERQHDEAQCPFYRPPAGLATPWASTPVTEKDCICNVCLWVLWRPPQEQTQPPPAAAACTKWSCIRQGVRKVEWFF